MLRDGWLATGDIVRMDAEGYFTIIDRKKDLIKVNEFQVWPREIETVLSHHPAIYEAGVISTPPAHHRGKDHRLAGDGAGKDDYA